MNTPLWKKLSKYALAYAMWLASFLLWIWFVFRSREAISGVLLRYYIPGPVEGTFQRTKQLQSFNQFYLYLGGLVWLILMIVVENYFREGAKRGILLKRIGKILGPQLLLLFAADLVRMVSGISTPLDWIALFAELLLGAGLVWIAIRTKEPPRPGLIKNTSP